VNVRLIAATNRDLAQMVAEKPIPQRPFLSAESIFRFFAPPLRERASDIPVFGAAFVATHSRRMG